jgi:protein-histidine pros-kinase
MGALSVQRCVFESDDAMDCVTPAAIREALPASVPDAVIVTDATGRVAHWNPAAVTVLGHRAGDALHVPLADLIAPGGRSADLEDALAEVHRHGEARAEVVVRHPAGSLLYVDFVLRRLRAPCAGHVVWAGRDVTQSRLARTMRHVHERYGELLESTPDGMVLVGETGHILLANANAERLFGYDSGELRGQPVDRLVPEGLRRRHAAQREGYFAQPRVRAMGAGSELRGRRKTGDEFSIEVSLSPLRTDEGFVVISAVRDVSERANAMRTLRELLEAAPDAIVITDADGRIVLANSQTDALFGYTREQLVGQPVEALLPERFRAAHVGHRTAFLDQPRVRAMGAGLELHARHRDGREFPVEVSLSPIRSPDGMLTSAAIRDISERRSIERRLQEQNLQLARASQAKTNFLAGMSHELRTPLNAIIGFTGTLLMKLPGPLTAEQEKQLRTVQWAGQHLLTLINDLLDLTRIESGETRLELAPVDVVEVAREAAQQVRGQAESKGLDLQLQLPDAAVGLQTDRRSLTQILMNLLANAVKYTDAGSVSLAVVRTPTGCRFRVADTGIGISAADRDRLFHAFSRLERGNATRPGTGLGLYLSAQLAALLGGRIDVESTLGVGSTFTLTLPER